MCTWNCGHVVSREELRTTADRRQRTRLKRQDDRPEKKRSEKMGAARS